MQTPSLPQPCDDYTFIGLLRSIIPGFLSYILPGAQLIEEIPQPQSQADPFSSLLTEEPMIKALLTQVRAEAKMEGKREAKMEAKIEGKMEGLIEGEIRAFREAVLGFVANRLPLQIQTQVKQTVTSTQNADALKKFFYQLTQAPNSDEQTVLTLLGQSFPFSQSIQPIQLKSSPSAEDIQKTILDIVSDSFPSQQVVSAVQQAIMPVRDVEQLRKFRRQLVQATNEQEVLALLAQSFPASQQPAQ